jgi:DNA repair protein RadA/Sms
VATDQLDVALKEIHETDARLVVIDSLQGLRKYDSKQKHAVKHTQLVVRDIATELIDEAQIKKRTIVLVSHVNKAGDLAGLKEIEHLVDTLLWFRGDRSGERRYLMSEKNRFGRTDVQAHFLMTEHGLIPTQPPERRGAGEQAEQPVEHAPEPVRRPGVEPLPVQVPEPMPERSPIRPAPVEVDGVIYAEPENLDDPF